MNLLKPRRQLKSLKIRLNLWKQEVRKIQIFNQKIKNVILNNGLLIFKIRLNFKLHKFLNFKMIWRKKKLLFKRFYLKNVNTLKIMT